MRASSLSEIFEPAEHLDFLWQADSEGVYLSSGEPDELDVMKSILQSVPLTGGLDQTVAR